MRPARSSVPRSPLPPAPVAGPTLAPSGALLLAAAAGVGALVARPLALALPVVLAGVVVLLRRPVLLAVPVALAASALGARSADGLVPPPPGPVAGPATLVSDPVRRWGTAEAVARLGGRHVLLRADGAGGDVLAARLAGERVEVTGRLRPLPAGLDWLRVRHVAARVDARTVAPGGQAAAPWRAANHVRRVLARGAEPLGDDGRARYVGLVLGDTRGHPPEMVDDFRGSGLAHLLAVSGQNVAFVLAAAGPGLRRLRPGPRLVAVLALLGLFATATRFEPSVLRAVAMAGAATVATTRGRPTSGLHLLGLAVAGLLLLDPLLVRSVGFQLSVAATAGILVLGPRLAAVLPGPAPLVAPVAVTVGAQLGVAPLLVAVFGGVPVASLPANVLAAPAAAVIMTWGLPAGLVAGTLGPPWDRWLHGPTGLATGWLGGVARAGASVPLGEMGVAPVAVVAGALGVLVALSRRPRGRGGGVARGVAVAVVAGALAAPGVVVHRPPLVDRPAPGVVVWRQGGGTVVVVAPGTGVGGVLEGLRRSGVVAIDVLVVGPGATAGEVERGARHRARVGRTWHLGRDPPAATPPVRAGALLVVRHDARTVCVRPGSVPACPS